MSRRLEFDGMSPAAVAAAIAAAGGASLIHIDTAAMNSVGGGVTMGGGVTPGWLFDAAAVESVGMSFSVPTGWNTIKYSIYWANSVASAGDVVWRSFHNNFAAGTDVQAAGASEGSITSTALGAGLGIKVQLATGLAVTPGNLQGLRIDRLATDVGDTVANDVWLFGVDIEKLT